MSAARKRARRLGLLGLIVGGAILAMAFLQLEKNTVYFYTPKEAVSDAQKLSNEKIRLAGMVEGGSIDWQPESLSLAFRVTDFKGTVIQVSYKGSVPDMFKENSGVVVEGRLSPDGQKFVASTIMAKHSEEYKVPEEMQSMNSELLRESILK